jgi:MinD superfamily P-loop ATPase
MIIAVASGKGGTGKTTVALALAAAINQPVKLLDCDAEEPNCHLFLRSEIERCEPVTIPVPTVNNAHCTGCGQCAKICRYNAIALVGKRILIFPELCHSCGGCVLVCASGALTEIPQEIGIMEFRHSGSLELISGQLAIGQAMSPPLIRAVKKHIAITGDTIIDCPPGTSCPVVTAVRGADFVLLVTEPTPFGLHDLTLAVAVIRTLGMKFGVVINRADTGDNGVRRYCNEENIPLLLEIPDRREIAEAYSRGETLLQAVPELKSAFEKLLTGIKAGQSANKAV